MHRCEGSKEGFRSDIKPFFSYFFEITLNSQQLYIIHYILFAHIVIYLSILLYVLSFQIFGRSFSLSTIVDSQSARPRRRDTAPDMHLSANKGEIYFTNKSTLECTMESTRPLNPPGAQYARKCRSLCVYALHH